MIVIDVCLLNLKTRIDELELFKSDPLEFVQGFASMVEDKELGILKNEILFYL